MSQGCCETYIAEMEQKRVRSSGNMELEINNERSLDKN